MNQKIDLSLFKSEVSNVKAMIRQSLKVDAGHSSALNIMAVSLGYKDYHTAVGLSKQSFYEVRVNVGIPEKPFYITKELGYHSHSSQAQNAAYELLEDCNQFILWDLWKDDCITDIQIQSRSKPKKGFEYHCIVSGDTIDDVQDAIENMKNNIDAYEGGSGNPKNSYRFVRSGNEHHPATDVNCLIPYHEFALLDSRGIIDANDSQDEIYRMFCNREEEIEVWEHDLIYVRNITLDEAFDQVDTLHVVSKVGNIRAQGNFEGICEFLQYQEQPFYLFVEINRER